MNKTITRLSWLAIFIGIILRSSQFIFNRSLWFDEALISLNITDKTFEQLFEALNYNQGAPVGFLIVEKILVSLFGQSDLVLRVLPFSCSILSLFLFYKLSQLYLNPRSVPIALLIFSLVEPLIYYSSEVKQYSLDVLITIILLLLAKHFQQNTLTNKQLCFSVIVFIFSIWFSHPAIFVLIGLIITLYVSSIKNQERKKISHLHILTICSISSFVGLYYANLSKLNKNAIEFFGNGSFTPLPFNAQWLYNKYLEFFYFIEINKYWIPHILCLIGIYALFKQRKSSLFLLIAPIITALVLSGFHLYPFVHRLLLFIVPLVVILMVAGIDLLINNLWKNFPIIIICIIGLLIYYPLNNAQIRLANPRTFQEIKDCLSYIKQNQQPGDIIYIHSKAQYQFKFYSNAFGFNNNFKVDSSEYTSDSFLNRWLEKPGYLTLVQGIATNQPQDLIADLEKLKGYHRVWVLFSHFFVYTDYSIPVLNYLDQIGTRLDFLGRPGAYGGAKVYLYNLSPPETNTIIDTQPTHINP